MKGDKTDMNRNDKSFMVEKIRTKYVEKKDGSLDELRKLDKKVKAPAEVFAYIFGSISALIMGAGMSLVMTDLGALLSGMLSLFIGIAVGVVGIVGVALAYPIYKAITKKERERIAPEVLRISEELLK